MSGSDDIVPMEVSSVPDNIEDGADEGTISSDYDRLI